MFENILIAMVAGLFGALPAVIQWFSSRSTLKVHERKLANLSNELSLLERLLSISKGISTDSVEASQFSKTIQTEAERIFHRYQLLHESDKDETIHPLNVSFIRRALLLFQPCNAKGWVVHTIFYVMMLFVASIILTELQSPTIDAETGESEMIYLLIGLTVLMGPFFLLLQRIAIRIRHSGVENVINDH